MEQAGYLTPIQKTNISIIPIKKEYKYGEWQDVLRFRRYYRLLSQLQKIFDSK
jgi:hypothetical protein